jgi:hypothetical protein
MDQSRYSTPDETARLQVNYPPSNEVTPMLHKTALTTPADLSEKAIQDIGSIDGASLGRFCVVSQNQEFPLAYVWSAFPSPL